jgi:selenocysteine-specific elongation factor
MHVIATAGHVDHGKSTLVRALTGMEPDRWAEERRRGLTIGLGFAWTTLPGVGPVAFVDVPGHERFVPTMLAGVGAVPAVLFVVAADGGWMPQSTEHLAALDALGVRHGVLAVTRADLADPAPATADALARIARTSLGTVAAVAVSGRTGLGLPELRVALARLAAATGPADPGADVRLWIDRSFVIAGSGTVVTGTLTAGTLRVGDELALADGDRVRIRGLQALGGNVTELTPVARVAVNLRGTGRLRVGHGAALLTPDAWLTTDVVDVVLRGDDSGQLPRELVCHIGSAAVAVSVRPLGPQAVRLRLARALPLRVGDRALLRDPGRHRVAARADVLDIEPPELRRRGAAGQRAALLADLATATATRRAENLLRARGFLTPADFRLAGLPVVGEPVDGELRADPATWRVERDRVPSVVTEWLAGRPLAAGMPVEVLRQVLGLPTITVAERLIDDAGLSLVDGVVGTPGGSTLPAAVAGAVDTLSAELTRAPFAAPTAGRLAELGLGSRELAAAVRAGRLLKLADGIVLLPDARERAVAVLATLPTPFTVSQARAALGTSRRVAVPLLEMLDRDGVTESSATGTRRLT